MLYAITSGFLVGLLGSFHCIGMCGPIALALPIHKQKQFQKIASILSYNLGRVLTYAIIGLLFGIVGKTLFIGKYQQLFSIAIGMLLLLILFVPYFGKKIGSKKNLWSYQLKIQKKLSMLFSREKNILNLFIIGVLNGLLPCGLIYMAVAGALSTGNIQHAILFMFFFGIATIPMMFSIALFGNYVSMSIRHKINKAVPFIIATMAVLLVVRGLNLGIPYISPKIEKTATEIVTTCCHKE